MTITREDLRQELERFVTRDELRHELERFMTREELHRELERFATREELRHELERFATKEDLERFATKDDLEALREETAQGFAEQRRYMEVLYEDLRATLKNVLDTIVGRLDGRDRLVDHRLDDHETRVTALELRVTRLEH